MIKVIEATSNPIQLMGKVSGCCYDSDTESLDKNYKRGLKCLKDEHGRVLEYPDVILSIEGYSARCIREYYTHRLGTTCLQASTRYIDYDNMDYYLPESIEFDSEAGTEYYRFMNECIQTYKKLIDSGIPKEDVANILPLGMMTKVVTKINLRALFHLAELRLCSRAYIEIQDMVKEIIDVVSGIDSEWKELMTYMNPKCKACTEKENCVGR